MIKQLISNYHGSGTVFGTEGAADIHKARSASKKFII